MNKIKECCQQTAADILTQFSFANNFDDFSKMWDEIYERYDLRRDPFTFCPVTIKEYSKNMEEYRRQKNEQYMV